MFHSIPLFSPLLDEAIVGDPMLNGHPVELVRMLARKTTFRDSMVQPQEALSAIIRKPTLGSYRAVEDLMARRTRCMEESKGPGAWTINPLTIDLHMLVAIMNSI